MTSQGEDTRVQDIEGKHRERIPFASPFKGPQEKPNLLAFCLQHPNSKNHVQPIAGLGCDSPEHNPKLASKNSWAACLPRDTAPAGSQHTGRYASPRHRHRQKACRISTARSWGKHRSRRPVFLPPLLLPGQPGL